MLYNSDLLVVSRYVQKLFILPLSTLHDEMGKSRSKVKQIVKSRSRQAHGISFFIGCVD